MLKKFKKIKNINFKLKKINFLANTLLGQTIS